MKNQILKTIMVMLFISNSLKAQTLTFNWSRENEVKIHNLYSNGFKDINISETERNKLADCALSKLKHAFPNGVNTTAKKWYSLNSQFAEACSKELNYIVAPKWTASSTSQLRAYIKLKITPEISPAKQNEVTDCVIDQIKMMHPNEVPTRKKVLDAIFEVLIPGCIKAVKIKVKKNPGINY